MIGKTISHYRITDKLAGGGMGVVYKAEDTKLKRAVALKFLPPELTRDEEAKTRFIREAQAASALQHHNICTIHEIDETPDGHLFICMDYYDGETLRERIARGPLGVDDALDVTIQLATGLAKAHDAGIIHRDIKPANIVMTRDGVLKILDFGVAKLTGDAGITKTGVVIGTVAYMSPEQIRGDAIDHRSDIWSLGAVFYEMVTGRRPFPGEHEQAVVYSILNDDPGPIAAIRSGFSPQLQLVVDKMLAKAPAERYESAAQLLADLERCARGSGPIRIPGPRPDEGVTRPTRSRRRLWPALALGALLLALFGLWLGRPAIGPFQKKAPTNKGGIPTIAILPFVNMSPDPDQEYFSDGISEELSNLLAKIADLRVVARTSSFSFKGQNVGIPEIAKRLNVAYVLEGSVRKSDNKVRITAQLIHAADGFHLWSETYDRTLDDIFKIQDEIAADVVKRLQITLLGTTPTTRKTDPEAYALYLQSIQLTRQNSKDALEKSDSLLHRVLEIDSTYAPAWTGLAANMGNRAVSGLITPEEGFTRARDANMRALEIDPQYASAYAGLAFIAMYGDGDFAAAAKHLERAFALAPTNVRVLGNSATLLNLLGRRNEAVSLWEAVALRDPVNVYVLFNLGTSQINAGRLDEAIASYRTVLSLSPGNSVAHYQLGVAMLLKGDGKSALAEFEQEPAEVFRIIGLPMAYHALGRKAESDSAFAALIARYEKDAAYNVAGIHAFRGEADLAFEWLDKERKSGGTFAEIVVDPLFNNLYDDPRWVPFLREIGKAPEQLAKIDFKVTPPE